MRLRIDSSDDGEGVVTAGKKWPDGDDDMFAPTEKEESEELGKKQDKFMRLGDIEGQEFELTLALDQSPISTSQWIRMS